MAAELGPVPGPGSADLATADGAPAVGASPDGEGSTSAEGSTQGYDYEAIAAGLKLIQKANRAIEARSTWTDKPGADWHVKQSISGYEGTPTYNGTHGTAALYATEDGTAYEVCVYSYAGKQAHKAVRKTLDAAFRTGQKLANQHLAERGRRKAQPTAEMTDGALQVVDVEAVIAAGVPAVDVTPDETVRPPRRDEPVAARPISLTEFKRRAAQCATFTVEHHRFPGRSGPRAVDSINMSRIRATRPGADRQETNTAWPKASLCRIEGNRITFLHDRDRTDFFTYMFPFPNRPGSTGADTAKASDITTAKRLPGVSTPAPSGAALPPFADAGGLSVVGPHAVVAAGVPAVGDHGPSAGTAGAREAATLAAPKSNLSGARQEGEGPARLWAPAPDGERWDIALVRETLTARGLPEYGESDGWHVGPDMWNVMITRVQGSDLSRPRGTRAREKWDAALSAYLAAVEGAGLELVRRNKHCVVVRVGVPDALMFAARARRTGALDEFTTAVEFEGWPGIGGTVELRSAGPGASAYVVRDHTGHGIPAPARTSRLAATASLAQWYGLPSPARYIEDGQEPPAASAARVTDGAPPVVDAATTPETADNPQDAPAPVSHYVAEPADLATEAVLTLF